jgi:hypothetical protein
MMKRAMLALVFAAATAGAVASTDDAPADRTFGPFKYTPISTRTKIGALGRAYRERWADDASILHDAVLVESSLRAWAQQYPRDRWLAPTAYHLAQLYQELQTNEARAKAREMYDYLAKTFPASKEAHRARARLQAGFPPLQIEPAVSPTPNPYAPATPTPTPTATPTPEPTATPTPAPTPTPTPTPKPRRRLF